MRTTRKALIGLAAAACVCAAVPAAAQIVDNGSFEDPIVGGNFVTVSGNAIADWTIGGNVDHVGNYWPAQAGSQSVDMNGFGSMGSLTQTLSLSPLQTYTLSFWLSGNPDGPPDPKTLDVSVSNTTLVLQSVSHARPASTAAMGWTEYVFNFDALAGGGYDLLFQSTSAAAALHYGPVLDNVSVTLVPEPGSYALLLAGLGLLGFAARRRKQQIAFA